MISRAYLSTLTTPCSIHLHVEARPSVSPRTTRRWFAHNHSKPCQRRQILSLKLRHSHNPRSPSRVLIRTPLSMERHVSLHTPVPLYLSGPLFNGPSTHHDWDWLRATAGNSITSSSSECAAYAIQDGRQGLQGQSWHSAACCA
jgi:hypothetical protein